MLRQDRGVYLQVYFTGTISVLASGKRLWPDEWEESSAWSQPASSVLKRRNVLNGNIPDGGGSWQEWRRNHQDYKGKGKTGLQVFDTSSLPVEVIDLYPERTTDVKGRLKDEFIEIRKEESSRLERVPTKLYILKTVRHKVISKYDMEKYPEERQILVHPLLLSRSVNVWQAPRFWPTLSSACSCIIFRSTV